MSTSPCPAGPLGLGKGQGGGPAGAPSPPAAFLAPSASTLEEPAGRPDFGRAPAPTQDEAPAAGWLQAVVTFPVTVFIPAVERTELARIGREIVGMMVSAISETREG